MAVRTAPCSWEVDYSDCTDLDVLENSGDPQMFEEMAVQYLWNWTGRKFGVCEVTVRPCREDCAEGYSTFFGWGPLPGAYPGGAPWRPVIVNGRWYNLGCGVCGDTCGCTRLEQVTLPGPIASIESITINGEVLPDSAYRVDDNRHVVRLDGGEWPLCQDLAAPVTEENTWEITYKRGVPVPSGGSVAAGVLALELAKAACNDKSCRLPQRVQTVTRQGVTIAMLDAFDDVEKGHTGIWIIDSWLSSINRAPIPSRVFSPDVGKKARRVTWPVI
jgi:hypothetical protein